MSRQGWCEMRAIASFSTLNAHIFVRQLLSETKVFPCEQEHRDCAPALPTNLPKQMNRELWTHLATSWLINMGVTRSGVQNMIHVRVTFYSPMRMSSCKFFSFVRSEVVSCRVMYLINSFLAVPKNAVIVEPLGLLVFLAQCNVKTLNPIII